MYRIYSADKDTYITNKIVSGVRSVSSSVGYASTLDLYKLYGATTTLSGGVRYPEVELSRALLHFDLDDLSNLHNSGKIDINSSDFKCNVILYDVYGGQPTPANYELVLSPLSRSFDEGFGKDVVFYTDLDVANFLSSSRATGEWYLTGAGLGLSVDSATSCDFFTTLSGETLQVTQSFVAGTENLEMDVTKIVSSTLAGIIPDAGFRLSFIQNQEEDSYTYFVKRFATRHAYDSTKRPRLIVKYPDSVSDDSATMTFGVSGSLFLYNQTPNGPTNVLSGSSEVTGSSCLILELTTPVSGGTYSSFSTGSQYKSGASFETGIYNAAVRIDMTPSLQQILSVSGSVPLTPIWKSLDGSVAFVTGSVINFYSPSASQTPLGKKKYVVTTYGIPQKIERTETTLVRVNVFDSSNPALTTVRIPVTTTNVVPRRAYYSIRDVDTSEVVVPFDTTNNSTRLSTDSNGCYFYLEGKSTLTGRSYVIDIMIVEPNDASVYRNVSSPFQVL